MPELVLLDEYGKAHQVAADGLVVDPRAVTAATGWELKPEGLCRGDVCVPVRDRPVTVEGGIDLAVFADAVGDVLAADVDEGVAALVPGPTARAAEVGEGKAPVVELADLDGNPVRFPRPGRKTLLLAWASW